MPTQCPGTPIAHALRLTALATLCVSSIAAATNYYSQTNLVTDDQAFLTGQGYTAAATVDPLLINPWGISLSPSGPFWLSNQGTQTSTLYNGAGTKIPLTVTIPGIPGPTGQVFTGGSGFVLSNGAPALFLFANLDGTISGWNGTAGTSALATGAAAMPGAYTGLAIATNGTGKNLYAANAITGSIDVYDSNFNPLPFPGGFVDPGANPDGLRPFNIQALGGRLYVTYAIPGMSQDEAPLGSGFVSEFNPDGTFIRRIANGGALSSPWGLALAPKGFGEFSGALLVGNFSDTFGTIDAYDPATGSFLGSLKDAGGNAIVIPDLWGLTFGNGGNGGLKDTLYFAAGIGDEQHGLFGSFGAVPEPASWATMMLGFGLVGAGLRRRQAALVAG